MLGKDKGERQKAYKDLFKVQVGKELLKEIRESTNRGLAFGGDSFSAQIEKLTNTRVTKSKIGRLRRNKCYTDPTYSLFLIILIISSPLSSNIKFALTYMLFKRV